MRAFTLAVLGLGVAACTTSTSEPPAPAPTPTAAPPPPTAELTFEAYHSQDDIHAFLTGEAAKHPDLVTFATLGASRQSRAIEYVTLTNTPGAPAIYLNGTHHGDEWSATESVLGLVDYLVAHRDDAAVKSILDAYSVVVQPLVNPDGHVAQTREDSEGNDPNRDYAYPTGDASKAFQLPEIQLVRDLLDRLKPRGAAAYHSGIQEVLWSWCYTANEPADAASLEAAGKRTAEAMGFDRYLQSYDDYATTGEFIDYAYQQYGTLALTFEVSTVKTPPASDLDGIVQTSIKGALAFMGAVQERDAAPAITTAQTQSFHRRGQLGVFGIRTAPRLE